jgi:hypothetical protein
MGQGDKAVKEVIQQKEPADWKSAGSLFER